MEVLIRSNIIAGSISPAQIVARLVREKPDEQPNHYRWIEQHKLDWQKY